jgi:hypothetical protein
MTTTNTYNPIFRAFRELTSAQAFRWYLQQLQTTATLAQTIAHYSFTTTQRLLSDSFAQRFRHRFAIAPAIAEPELAKAPHPVVQDDGKPAAVLENAIAASLQIALTEAAESPVSDDWEEKATHQEYATTIEPEPEQDDSEGDRIAIDEPEQAISLSDAEAIADDSKADAEMAWGDDARLDDEDDAEDEAGDEA